MDQNTVYQLFVATYHPDPNIHKQAELNIRNVNTNFSFFLKKKNNFVLIVNFV
jgi:hypothetical protein